MIGSLLVANRGEIACRIFRTARRLGVRTIAVYSDADATARHVRAADMAVRLGPAPARESYLDIERLLDAARASGAEAIHPGYGFLSENAAFAAACESAGLRFVGPPSAAIAAMGSKILAKAQMRAAGVPVLPGYEGAQQGLDELAAQARRLGFPLIIKPAAGGGGKGMQIVRGEAELVGALAAARRLAESAFADGALLLERYLPAPRHVEVQVFADMHGNVVHLGDRDCSIQRRHQKLIEEAPAPGLPDDVRARLRAAALTVARSIAYVSAGTVEFLYDGRDVYFMEMNTRLQVEHTVTEAVTGLDLVEWQLRVASGEALPRAQADIHIAGHAIEARVCAEDPARDFLPSAGRLALLRWPQAPDVRVDAGFGTGDSVPSHYDSLLGKVIAFAPDRAAAAQRLARALEDTLCVGVRSNEHWLAGVLRAPDFLALRHSIAWLGAHAASLAVPAEPEADLVALAALNLLGAPGHAAGSDPGDPWACTDGFIPNLGTTVHAVLEQGARRHTAALRHVGGAAASLRLGQAPELTIGPTELVVDCGLTAAALDGRRASAWALRQGRTLTLWDRAGAWDLALEDPEAREFSSTASHGGLTTPLPGVVVAVHVRPGQSVSAGEVLMVVEAMKMEHAITAPFAGVVETVRHGAGERVAEGSELLTLIEPGAAKTADDGPSKLNPS